MCKIASKTCVSCRMKKIKCSGEKPEYKHCKNAKIQCEDIKSKKRGPPKGNIQALENRLNQIERKLMLPEITVNGTSYDNLPTVSDEIEPQIQIYRSPRRTLGLPSMEIINHLTDIFFKYINSVLFFVHQPSFKKSIHDGTVSERLLYSIMALSSRFSEHPSIRSSPPYCSSQFYVQKAYSLIDCDSMEPRLDNIPFWAIMSFLEYGSSSGQKSSIYGSMAIRFCQVLQYYNEDVLSTPIINDKGDIDTVSMSARRHLFWTCYYIDKLSSTGTHTPQCIERTDVDARLPILPEIAVLQDSKSSLNIFDNPVSDNSLLNITSYFASIVGLLGDVNKCMNRANTRQSLMNWPPIAEFKSLDSLLCSWADSLPGIYQFNKTNLEYHKRNAGAAYFREWLSAHAFWCSSIMLIHRGSLMFNNLRLPSVSKDFCKEVQLSVNKCVTCVDSGIEIFSAICDSCGFSTLPYIGYSSYIFATTLMASIFSSSPDLYKKSSGGLKMLCQLTNKLAPHWPVCEKLGKIIYDLKEARQNLYQFPDDSKRCSFELNGVNDIELSNSARISVNSVSPLTHSPTSLSIVIPPSSSLSPPAQSLSSNALFSTNNSPNHSPIHYTSPQINMIPPLSVSPSQFISTNSNTYDRKGSSSDYTMFPQLTDIIEYENFGSLSDSNKPFQSDPDKNDNPIINNFDILYDTSLFENSVFNSSSLYTSSSDPVPGISYPSSVTQESTNSAFEPHLLEGYTSEEQLATYYGSVKSQWNSINF